QQPTHHMDGRLIVIDEQDFQAGQRLGAATWMRGVLWRDRRSGHGQSDGELAAAAWPFARRADRPAVQFDERLDDREPDAQAAARASGRAIDLCEELENAGLHLRRNADAVVADGN